LADATAVLDAFHVVALGTRCVDEVRRRVQQATTAHEDHEAVDLTWQCAQQLRAAYKHPDKTEGRKIAERIVASFPSCPIPEIARLGRTLRRWREAFLAYFDTGATNGGTEAIIIWSLCGGVADVADVRVQDVWATRYLDTVADVPHLAVAGE
jgi:transposase